jgi:hypothetical protein
MSAQRPWTIHLWKKQGTGSQPLIARQRSFQCGPDGKPFILSLLNPSPKVGGDAEHPDFQFSVVAEPTAKDMDGPMRRSKWSVTVQAVSGGLVETKDRFMYYAPEKGYQTKLRWTNDGPPDHQIFFRIRDGKLYGKATFTVFEDYQARWAKAPMPYSIGIGYTVNPTGSRSLEPDPKRTYKSYEDYLKAEKQKCPSP